MSYTHLSEPSCPSFIIRDLDKDPHGPSLPPKPFMCDSNMLTPGATPNNSPKNRYDGPESTITRSESDLSTYSTSSSEETRSTQAGRGSFPFHSLFKWKRTTSSSSVALSSGLPTPPIEEGSSRSRNYFQDHKGASGLDNLGISIQNSKSDFNSVVEAQLQEERRLRHLAEDRLAEVEEEVTRLCTTILPTDAGETGEAYFSSILKSVRLAIDSYEERTDALERELEQKNARLTLERRERTTADIECTGLRTQLKQAQALTIASQSTSELETKNAQLTREVQELKSELDELRKQSTRHEDDNASAEVEEDRATLLQKVKDTEAQRDALRQVSRGLRQRLTLEARRNADRIRALAAMDFNASRPSRSHSRNVSAAFVMTADNRKPSPPRDPSLSRVCESLTVPAMRPRPERFVTATEIPIH